MSAITQNTPAWEEMRKGMIGASDAPIIMGVSPYTSPHQLWEQKVGLAPSPFQNYAMKCGHDLEEPARQKMEEMTGMFFRPMVKFHSNIDWMMCSLDCMSLDNEVIGEIKTVGKEHARHLTLPKLRNEAWARLRRACTPKDGGDDGHVLSPYGEVSLKH